MRFFPFLVTQMGLSVRFYDYSTPKAFLQGEFEICKSIALDSIIPFRWDLRTLVLRELLSEAEL